MSAPPSGWRGSPPQTRGGRRRPARFPEVRGLTPADAGRTREAGTPSAGTWAHPRRRGEDATPGAPPWPELGSPPQTRGGPSGRARRARGGGLTPADAGRTSASSSRRTGTGAHPRRRGEDLPPNRGADGELGSPPQTRGGRPAPRCCRGHRRLTPADAGRTQYAVGQGAPTAAHPRRRGEDPPAVVSPTRAMGSPPQTRGGPPPRAQGTPRRGLTPADAGRTDIRPLVVAHGGAHPRRRGEDRTQRPGARRCAGSPPQTRGGRTGEGDAREGSGLTPADAARTSPGRCGPQAPWAHPRRRGEDDADSTSADARMGSPPQTRGGPADGGPARARDGLTPADAGRTAVWRRGSSPTPAHPRRRGEDRSAGRGLDPAGGSPPQTRGGRSAATGPAVPAGLTPADAGRTAVCCPLPACGPAHPRRRGEDCRA